MKLPIVTAALLLLTLLGVCCVHAEAADTQRDILVTFHNEGARSLSSGNSAPYRNRKRYAISNGARRNAKAIADEYALEEVDHWPIRSLTVYCFVYRIPASADRDTVVRQLEADSRIESVQPVQVFGTGTEQAFEQVFGAGTNNLRQYSDSHAGLQHSLTTMSIPAAHAVSRGRGVRIAIIDSDAQEDHEDLQGRLARVANFTSRGADRELGHGTAVASIIGAITNNGVGIVGVAPEAVLELFVACWSVTRGESAVCDSFTLAKSLDALLDDPPQILNMSIIGPEDPLLARLLDRLHRAGTIVVAAGAQDRFPASHESVIGVWQSDAKAPDVAARIYAPGRQIMVAIPGDDYDFSSGSSLAAAHVTGTIGLLLAVSPDLTLDRIRSLLQRSQSSGFAKAISVNACMALQLADAARSCTSSMVALSKLEPGTEDDS